jgi:hypothetical protein
MPVSVNFSTLTGKIIQSISGAEPGNDVIDFRCADGSSYRMFHEQDCCETVSIESISGDPEWLIGTPVLYAEERNGDLPQLDRDDSFTWTFYEIATVKGSVTIRWYGSSNGYYSEEVSFSQIQEVEG